LALGALMLAGAACSDDGTNTALKPEGPPNIEQVFVSVRQGGNAALVLALGVHPDLSQDTYVDKNGMRQVCPAQETPALDALQLEFTRDADGHKIPNPTYDPGSLDCDGEGDFTPPVTNAIAGADQEIRVIFDELMKGSTLEQFDCYCSKYCTAAQDPTSCCPNGILASLNETDCANNPTSELNETGQFLDEDLDGLPDRVRLLPGIVKVQCGDAADPTSFTDVFTSVETDGFYSPSGNQLIPTTGSGGVPDRLGPALQFNTTSGLETGADCQVVFADSVTDKDGNKVPPLAGTFHTEPLAAITVVPANGSLNVDLDQVITVGFNVKVDPATIAGIILRVMGGAEVPVTRTATPAGTSINITPDATLAPNTAYQIVIPTTVHDRFGGAFPAERVITFTTGT
jgi:hypothetical protein